MVNDAMYQSMPHHRVTSRRGGFAGTLSIITLSAKKGVDIRYFPRSNYLLKNHGNIETVEDMGHAKQGSHWFIGHLIGSADFPLLSTQASFESSTHISSLEIHLFSLVASCEHRGQETVKIGLSKKKSSSSGTTTSLAKLSQAFGGMSPIILSQSKPCNMSAAKSEFQSQAIEISQQHLNSDISLNTTIPLRGSPSSKITLEIMPAGSQMNPPSQIRHLQHDTRVPKTALASFLLSHSGTHPDPDPRSPSPGPIPPSTASDSPGPPSRKAVQAHFCSTPFSSMYIRPEASRNLDLGVGKEILCRRPLNHAKPCIRTVISVPMLKLTATQRTTTLTRYFSTRRKAASPSNPTAPSQKQLTQHAISHPDDPPRSDSPYDETDSNARDEQEMNNALVSWNTPNLSAGGCGISIFISTRWNRNKAQRLWNAERRSLFDKLPRSMGISFNGVSRPRGEQSHNPKTTNPAATEQEPESPRAKLQTANRKYPNAQSSSTSGRRARNHPLDRNRTPCRNCIHTPTQTTLSALLFYGSHNPQPVQFRGTGGMNRDKQHPNTHTLRDATPGLAGTETLCPEGRLRKKKWQAEAICGALLGVASVSITTPSVATPKSLTAKGNIAVRGLIPFQSDLFCFFLSTYWCYRLGYLPLGVDRRACAAAATAAAVAFVVVELVSQGTRWSHCQTLDEIENQGNRWAGNMQNSKECCLPRPSPERSLSILSVLELSCQPVSIGPWAMTAFSFLNCQRGFPLRVSSLIYRSLTPPCVPAGYIPAALLQSQGKGTIGRSRNGMPCGVAQPRIRDETLPLMAGTTHIASCRLCHLIRKWAATNPLSLLNADDANGDEDGLFAGEGAPLLSRTSQTRVRDPIRSRRFFVCATNKNEGCGSGGTQTHRFLRCATLATHTYTPSTNHHHHRRRNYSLDDPGKQRSL
ncbi:uncharacterized protein CLUP02_01251 [Colletotrichum lupini]|uniref:Uncharacterized protein n=1 Tax=Colletotrichum lupini TaxID=145971 RepID=A0A9Q8W9R5_9PEZI|nr:uncharacterized protein CLUP02_01251 [Colletotrichum lupini]UQC74600.1 hypothetical protein CLUP02_01251 [Colletotrichum lupini]